jgi:hypothetical protein
MALTNNGFDGTVTEAAWAQMSALTDVDAVESSAAWAVTQGTGRQVSTAAHSGFAFAKGVLSKDTAAILTALATPVNGQWFLIVRHIDWATNGVTVTAVAHTTTTTTVPTTPPTSYPVLDATPGVLYDQPLAWAWVRSTDTTVTLFDLRLLPSTDTAWIKYTPTLSGITLGNGTVTGQHKKDGPVYHVQITITFGSTTSLGSYPKASLPFAPATREGGVLNYLGGSLSLGLYRTQAADVFFHTLSGDYITSSTPFTWASGHTIYASISYAVS